MCQSYFLLPSQNTQGRNREKNVYFILAHPSKNTGDQDWATTYGKVLGCVTAQKMPSQARTHLSDTEEVIGFTTTHALKY